MRWGPLVEGDILDRAALDGVHRDYRPVAVIHFAASPMSASRCTDPAQVLPQQRRRHAQSLLDAAPRPASARSSSSCSCATYGVPESLPIREETPQQPINPYGRTKLIVRADAARLCARPTGCATSPCAISMPPAPIRTGELGERHDPETHLIPRALMAAAGPCRTLEIFGDDYDTPDGTCVRDYIHVTDLAEAHVLPLRVPARGRREPRASISAAGKRPSIREILGRSSRVTGRDVRTGSTPRRPGDPPMLSADPALARATARLRRHGYSDIDTIVARPRRPASVLG